CAASRARREPPDRRRRRALRPACQRVRVLGRRREAHPGHAGGTRIRMRPRAAVFCLHDIVPDERLPDVEVTHRPYALAPEELRAHLVAARGVGLRTVTAGQVPPELGGNFFCLTFDDGSASDYAESFPALEELGMRATF